MKTKLCAAELANSDPTSGMNSSSAGNVNCNCCSRFLSSTSSRVLVLVVRLTAVPGASLAQLFPAACAASPAVQWGSSLRPSLLAGIVCSGALSNKMRPARILVLGDSYSLIFLDAASHYHDSGDFNAEAACHQSDSCGLSNYQVCANFGATAHGLGNANSTVCIFI